MLYRSGIGGDYGSVEHAVEYEDGAELEFGTYPVDKADMELPLIEIVPL